jgi:hypothetical protein
MVLAGLINDLAVVGYRIKKVLNGRNMTYGVEKMKRAAS